MQAVGTIRHGVLILDDGVSLPDGTRVSVTYSLSVPSPKSPPPRPVVLPIFDHDGPPDVDLTNKRIAEILDRADASC